MSELTGIIEEIKETLNFLEMQLEAGSRIEFIINHVEEIVESLALMLSDTSLPENIRVEAEALFIKARYIAEKAKNMLEMLERDTRNLRTRSRAWE